MRIGWPGLTSSGPCTRCWSRYVPLVEPRSSTYHWPPRLVSRACRELAKSSVSTSVESSARPMRIDWSPRVILVPVSGPAVTTSVREPRWPFFLAAGVARGGTDATRPARPPNRSARTTRNAAKMNSHSSSRKPKRNTWRTISGVTTGCPSVPCCCGTASARSRAVLPVHEDRVPDEDDVDVLAAHARVGEADVGLGAAADDVASGGQLVLRPGAVDDEQVGHARP